MGRKSLKNEKRAEILAAFARVLANHGYAGATVQNIASQADITPSLIHHYFKNKDDLLDSLIDFMLKNFKQNLQQANKMDETSHKLDVFMKLALEPKELQPSIHVKCWVSIMAESLRSPSLNSKVKKFLLRQAIEIQEIGNLSKNEAAGLLSLILGSFVFGSFCPNFSRGFALKSARKLYA